MKRSSIRIAVAAVVALFVVVSQRATVLSQVRNSGAPRVGAVPAAAVTQGFSEIVTVSKAGDAVWLYSVQTGKWHKQAIPAEQGPARPTTGIGVVAFRTRTMVYACSSQTGAWDSVELGEEPGQPTVGRNIAVFRAGNKLYGFSAEIGVWDSVEMGDGEAGQPTLGAFAYLETGSKVYAFSPKTGKWAVVDRDKP
jgi:hypothetical protein